METLLAHCLTAVSAHGGMVAVFFLGGLTGSLTHCLVMCGPVVACQAVCGGGCGSRMSAASQWQYHLGRLLTYGMLGFFAALLSRQIATASFWPLLSSLMMLCAASLFLLSALFPSPHRILSSPKQGFLRGVFMSFMPCGLIYAALMMAATYAEPLAAMVAMWLFVLGTIPALLLASGSAGLLAQRWREWISGIGRFGMACNGLALVAMAVRVVR